MKSTFGKKVYLPHHPVLNPNKPGKVRRVCNAASKYKEVCLSDKLLAGPGLLHGLIGITFRFREGPIALTADIESMFLQVQVHEPDISCYSVQGLTNLFRYTNVSVMYLELTDLQLCKLRSQASGTGQRRRVSNCSKGNTKQVLHRRIHKISRNPVEAIEVFDQLQPLLSQPGFELKKWISNNDAVTGAIPEDLKSISNMKQVEVETNVEGSLVLGLQWTVTDDSLQVCRGTNKEVETPISQRKDLSLVSSLFDPIGLFAPFIVHMRRLLKSIWTKNGQHWDNEVEPGEEAEFLRWKEQFPVLLKQASIEDTSTERVIKPSFMCLLTHLRTRCVQWPIYVHNQKNTQLT